MSLLKQIWKKWRAFGRVVGDAAARVFMTVFYFTVTVPFGIGVRLFADPLRLKSTGARWLARENKQATIEDARRLY